MGPLVAAMRKVKEREQKKAVELEGVGEDGTGTVGLGTAAGPLARPTLKLTKDTDTAEGEADPPPPLFAARGMRITHHDGPGAGACSVRGKDKGAKKSRITRSK